MIMPTSPNQSLHFSIQFSMADPEPRTVKAVLIGDSGVGKSSLFKQFEEGVFSTHLPSTVSGSFARVPVTSPDTGRTITIGLWDTAGQERFRSVVSVYFKNADFVILVCDLTDRQTFTNLNEWLRMAQDKAPETAEMIIVGNKADLDDRHVDLGELLAFGEAHQAFAVVETSAKTGTGLDILLQHIAARSGDQSILQEKKKDEGVDIDRRHDNNSTSRRKGACCR